MRVTRTTGSEGEVGMCLRIVAIALLLASANAEGAQATSQQPEQTLVGQPVAANATKPSYQPDATAMGGASWPSGSGAAATGPWTGGNAGGWPATATGSWPGATAGGAAGGWSGAAGGAAGGAGGWAGGAGGAGGWQGGAGGGQWQIPEWVATIPPAKIAHVSLGATAVLFVFPFGGMIHRVWYHYHNVWVHAAVQMMGYLLVLAAASIGLYMGAVQKKLAGFHPIMGMMLLGLLTIQPFTELINYFLFRRWPKIRYIGYIHIWKGRTILLLGMIHGGLGFAYSAKLDRELPMRKGPWPRVVPILYGIVAALVAILYTATITWTQIKNVRKANQVDPEEAIENGVAVRLEVGTFSQVRASIKRASESNQGQGEAGDSDTSQTLKGALSTAPPDEAVSPVTTQDPTVSSISPKSAPSRMSSVKKIFRSDAL